MDYGWGGAVGAGLPESVGEGAPGCGWTLPGGVVDGDCGVELTVGVGAVEGCCTCGGGTVWAGPGAS